ncbi:type II secretion system F family protein [Microbacterium sp. JB110]|uniref:type II secretion system F family protein n=1 Tax=Microbacterium sp. JB110 TaxID=2024477 RepID=UPI00097F5F6D|nr:type II secretion system F family protein [Microbacterium sp. JB110]RCS62132.1 type II secretion protein F [Microbacterium sp. JB110]SJM53484.1 Flp pilus assembly protein TadB [Frigoribacterium sp. JB110]
MTIVLGVVLAAGVLLVASPWLWPPGDRALRQSDDSSAARLLESAGFPRTAPRVLYLGCAAAGIVSAAIAWLVTTIPVLAALAMVAGGFAPVVWLRGRRASLIRARRGLWPDVCDLLIASVRAGMALPDAVSSLAESAPHTLRPAFAQFARDLAASGHFESSVDWLKSALADPLADRIVETLRMSRQVGGTELVPVLRALSASVRADAAVRGEVESRQSWTKGAAVLGVIAPWAILGMLALRPEGAEAYSSSLGIVVIVVGAVVSVVAYRLMIRVGRLPEPKRWFA